MGMNSTLEYIYENLNPQQGRKMPDVIHDINRVTTAQALADLGFKVGAEVGVAQGNHAAILCENIPDLKLYCIDVWKRYKGYLEYTNRIVKYHHQALRVLAPYDCEFIKKFSMDAVTDFEDRSLDFVYIDAAHDFKNVACDIAEWSKKVRYGGIVFGHDYKRRRGGRHKYICHVKDVVQAYCYSHSISPWFVLDIVQDENGKRVGDASWMFVRQEGDWV